MRRRELEQLCDKPLFLTHLRNTVVRVQVATVGLDGGMQTSYLAAVVAGVTQQQGEVMYVGCLRCWRCNLFLRTLITTTTNTQGIFHRPRGQPLPGGQGAVHLHRPVAVCAAGGGQAAGQPGGGVQLPRHRGGVGGVLGVVQGGWCAGFAGLGCG